MIDSISGINGFVPHYLNRLLLKGAGAFPPNLFTLKLLVAAHVAHIPFEYSKRTRQKKNALILEDIFEQIVLLKAGGYCYETGLLFNQLLKTFGFKTHLILGQIYRKGLLDLNSVHLAILVQLEENWLVDVSWFGGLSQPISFKGRSHVINGKIYKIKKHFLGFDLWEKAEGHWKKGYYMMFPDDMYIILQKKHLFHQWDKASEFYNKNILLYAA